MKIEQIDGYCVVLLAVGCSVTPIGPAFCPPQVSPCFSCSCPIFPRHLPSHPIPPLSIIPAQRAPPSSSSSVFPSIYSPGPIKHLINAHNLSSTRSTSILSSFLRPQPAPTRLSPPPSSSSSSFVRTSCISPLFPSDPSQSTSVPPHLLPSSLLFASTGAAILKAPFSSKPA